MIAQRVVKAFLYKNSRTKGDWDVIGQAGYRPPHGGDLSPSAPGMDNPSYTPLQRLFRKENTAEDELHVTVETQTSLVENNNTSTNQSNL